MKGQKRIFTGLIPPMVTPLDAAGEFMTGGGHLPRGRLRCRSSRRSCRRFPFWPFPKVRTARRAGAAGSIPSRCRLRRVLPPSGSCRSTGVRPAFRMPKDMTLMATFEMGLPFVKRNGLRGVVKDYSISEIGHGSFFREQVGEAVRQGLKVYSQANTAGLEWDFGTIPYNPAPYQWRRRWEAVCAARKTFNLQGVMECHHYGVWPGFLVE